MKRISAETKEIWLSGDYTGTDRRPYARATIQKMNIQRVGYWLPRSTAIQWRHQGRFASALFGQDQIPRELYNIKSISYDRSTDQDAASCTITLYNFFVRRPDEPADNPDDFDRPGYYTPNRGVDGNDFFLNRWGYEGTGWRNWIAPDRLIRTFEGYGLDHHLPPEEDEHMYPSGVWLVDKVSLNNNAEIVIECRDMAKLLLDQIAFPPIVPRGVYPVWWEKRTESANQPTHNIDDETVPTYDGSSNDAYDGVSGLHPDQEVNPGGDVRLHTGEHAFDSNPSTWWMSNGQKRKGYVWIQGRLSPGLTVQSLRLDPRGGPYKVYVSLYGGSGSPDWMGNHVIPYSPAAGDVDNGARIKYVDSFHVGAGDVITRVLPKAYEMVTKVRLTFTSLWDAGYGTKYPNQAAVQQITVGNTTTLVDAEGTHYDGNYDDYTDIIKWLCAWAGFYWPREGSGLAWVKYRGDDTRHYVHAASDDPVLPKGRVWGDFMGTGTSGVNKLPVETFDKQPLMDGINAVREIIGFEFWVDETGAAVWRLANMFKKGNYLMPAPGQPRSTRTTETIVIDENQVLMNIEVDLDSSNIRERVFVANVGGDFGYTVKGYNPNPSGLRRVGGWTDQNFKSVAECRRMAEMIALRQAMTYRMSRITIPANPAIQIDDQIHIYERTTGEGYLHRITGISSHYDNEEGTWTYDLTTHWLGDEPFTKWAFDPDADLSDTTKAWLRLIGGID